MVGVTWAGSRAFAEESMAARPDLGMLFDVNVNRASVTGGRPNLRPREEAAL